ncbi:MAG TPA: hypothetical protein VLS88_17715 [Polyangiales bacterium]|nr:hypothetical protein [Polyangiales bacterium]
MSNHYHIVLTDPQGVLPLFAAWMNRQVAMCVKRLRRWDEVVWEPNVALSAVELDGTKEVLDKIAYTILNPVSAGLVRSPEDWPGVLSTVAALRRGQVVGKRPSVWFKDTAPNEATLRLTTPRGFADQGVYHEALGALITHRLNTLHQRAGGYLGPARVKQTSVRDRPSSKKRRFGRNPMFSALTRERWIEAVKRLRAFRHAYREAYLAWRDGCDRIEFPLGTWWLVRYARAPIAA